ncbi:hypothetical protein JTE90_027934 [Oedothorax gibbosus]|uniref:Uncharacterized protein n=1 Tax=Oedothorax gibbosus TaxID=931172 RepID=A0AAV6VEX1_9ARAC|nr:hypothetical protein JTE90_027934 [Oedothorax gibbosus]
MDFEKKTGGQRSKPKTVFSFCKPQKQQRITGSVNGGFTDETPETASKLTFGTSDDADVVSFIPVAKSSTSSLKSKSRFSFNLSKYFKDAPVTTGFEISQPQSKETSKTKTGLFGQTLLTSSSTTQVSSSRPANELTGYTLRPQEAKKRQASLELKSPNSAQRMVYEIPTGSCLLFGDSSDISNRSFSSTSATEAAPLAWPNFGGTLTSGFGARSDVQTSAETRFLFGDSSNQSITKVGQNFPKASETIVASSTMPVLGETSTSGCVHNSPFIFFKDSQTKTVSLTNPNSMETSTCRGSLSFGFQTSSSAKSDQTFTQTPALENRIKDLQRRLLMVSDLLQDTLSDLGELQKLVTEDPSKLVQD